MTILFITVGLAFGVVILSALMAMRNHDRSDSEKRPWDLAQKVKTYGRNSNSFLTLYPGFRYFRVEKESLTPETVIGTALETANARRREMGLIAYVESGRAWVAATEPLIDETKLSEAWKVFAEGAKAHGRVAICIPVSEGNAKKAKRVGYGALMIGSEPVFELEKYDPNLKLVPSAKHMYTIGARVNEYSLSSLPNRIREACDEITKEWLSSRRFTPLSFLNRVMPWEQGEEKKYFVLEHKGQVLAFTALIPIFPRNGWYLIDLVRHNKAPVGSAELLVLETLAILKKQGSKEVSMGVAPLSNLSLAPWEEHPVLYSILDFMFNHTNFFYRFEPLYRFKLKFKPTRIDPAYLVYCAPRIGLFQTLDLLEAFLPGGIINASWSFVRRFMGRLHIFSWLNSQLSTKTIARTIPRSGWEGLVNCPVTVFLIAVNVYLFLMGSLIPSFSSYLRGWTLTWERLCHGEWYLLFLFSFYHRGMWHLYFDLLLMGVSIGLIEILGGSLLAILCYVAASLVSFPLTLTLLQISRHLWKPWVWEHAVSAGATGCSLGLVACLGALTLFLKRGVWMSATIAVGAIFYSLTLGTVTDLAYLVSLALGFGVSYRFLNR